MNTQTLRSTVACEFTTRREIARLLHDAEDQAARGCPYEARRLRRIAEAETERLRRARLGLTPA